jgi:hypothetical protein
MGQQNAWFDRVVFEWWAVEVILPFIQSKFRTEQKVALILDNFKDHQEVQLPKQIITVAPTRRPGNGYKTALLADMVGAVDSNVAYELSQTKTKKRVVDDKNIKEGWKPHIRDCCEILSRGGTERTNMLRNLLSCAVGVRRSVWISFIRRS